MDSLRNTPEGKEDAHRLAAEIIEDHIIKRLEGKETNYQPTDYE